MGSITERIVVQMTSAQREAIELTATRSCLNNSEWQREDGQGFSSKADEGDEEGLNALIERASTSASQANEALDDALAYIRASNQRIDAMNTVKR